MCLRAKFWDRLILPQILVVFKSPTTKIEFVDFLKIQAAFWKTNYTTVNYLPIPIYGSFENEALENEDRSTKHPNLENEAPKTRKRSTQILKTKHPNLENEAPTEKEALENEAP